MTTPLPTEWHPAYEPFWQWLLDWLEGRGPRTNADTIEVAFPRRIRLTTVDADIDPTPPEPIRHRLRRQTAWGLAPYVGDPFIYVWSIATDELGRSVATDSKIRYVP